eukprot:TRINITY_DN6193_c0_g1_i1.p1 TRINITY_DN6193_c0_g1~~TRINITY_DN6193_c0_g1_i1.p1  ORF type:complete len:187 (-),score=54.65 TRINITY_DN6193_c0_g1_i1:145-705(-)
MQSYQQESYQSTSSTGMMNNGNCECASPSCPMCCNNQTQSQMPMMTQQTAQPLTTLPVCTTVGSDRPLHTAAIQREEKFLQKEEVNNHKLASKEQTKAQKLMQKAEKEHARVEQAMMKGKTNAVVRHEAKEAELISSSQVHMRAAQVAAQHAMEFRDKQGIKQPPPETLTTSTTTITPVIVAPPQY